MAATDVIVVIGGANLTPFARVGRVRIDDLLNDAPNAAALTLVVAPRYGPPESGPFAAHAFDNGAYATMRNNAPTFAPPPIATGAPIQIYLSAVAPANQIFGGEVLQREQYAEFDRPEHVRYDLTCTDHTRRLNRRKVMKAYGAASASELVQNVIAEFAPGITTANVQAGLATVTGGITFTFEDVSRSLSRIAEKIGAYWYVDYAADLHFFVGTEAGPAPAPIVPGADFADLKISADLSQVRTRILVEGDGGTATATIAAGETLIPISQTLPFSATGGLVRIGDVRGSYTGTTAGGAKTNTAGVGTPGTGGTPAPAPPGSFTVAIAPSVVGDLAGGPYYYAATFELSDGSRSDIGAASGPITIAAIPAPATGPGFSFPTSATVLRGPIRVGVESSYAASFMTADGAESTATPGIGTISGRAVKNPPSAPAFSAAPISGSIELGYYGYVVTFLTPAGETLPSAVATKQVIANDSGAVRILLPNPLDERVTGWRIYRSTRSDTPALAYPWRHVVDVPGHGPNTLFDDKMPDIAYAPRNYPQFTTATDVGESALIYPIPVSPDPRVVRRRLYRKDGTGEFRRIHEIPNNQAEWSHVDESTGPGGEIAPAANRLSTGAVNLSGIPLGPAGTVRRRLFRSTAGGPDYRELATLANNSATTFTDTVADTKLGGTPLPPQGGPGTSGTGPPPAPIGATSLQIETLAGFPGAGWAVVESVLIRYSSQSTAGGNFLTGIPASGPGAITAAIPAGTVITASPMLLGVAPAVAVTLGDAIQLLAQVDDVPAQAALAAVEGGDGIVEHYIQDRRLSFAGAHARGSAELALFKTIETTVTYTTRDLNTRSGATVSINLPAPTNLIGAFRIQRVTIDQVTQYAHTFPRRSVSASTTRLSFEDVLNRILLEQT